MEEKKTLSFEMPAKVGKACQYMSDYDASQLLMAICNYGFYGEEPDLYNTNLKAIFLLVREEVDASRHEPTPIQE